MREITFRTWYGGKMHRWGLQQRDEDKTLQFVPPIALGAPQMQFTGLTDKNGKEIYEGDVVEFTDKWEWYRGTYAIPMMFAKPDEHASLKAKYDAEPMHRLAVEFDPYEGYNLSKYENEQHRYAVIGNIYENPELLK